MMKKLLLFLVMSLGFVGCLKGEVNMKEKVLNNTYVLQNVIENSEITITFGEDRLYGSSGVNNYNGEYKIDGNKIEVGVIAGTRMMGPEDLMAQEQQYLDNLTAAKEIKATETGIEIITKTGVKLNFDKK